MNTAKLFKNGNSQAIRLPKQFRFEGKQVYVKKLDDALLLYPESSAWKLFDSGLEKFSDDFMKKRNQPKISDKRPKI